MRYFTKVGATEREFRFERKGDLLFAHTGDQTMQVDAAVVGDGTAYSLLVDGQSFDLILDRQEGAIIVLALGERLRVEVLDEREKTAKAVAGVKAAGRHEVTAVMPGIVVDILVKEGDKVDAGQTLLVLEAMKMQNPLRAEAAGVVRRVLAKKGAAVAAGALLVEIE